LFPERFSEMDPTQLSHDLDTYAPPSIPERVSSRFYLRANTFGGEDLWDPPNTAATFARLEAAIDETKDFYDPPETAEAFARLQTAIDEDKRWGSVGDDGHGDFQMLDPPTTAERFYQIESAIGEVLAGPTSTTRSSRRPKKSKPKLEASARVPASFPGEKSHVLKRKRQIQFAPQSMSHFSERAGEVDTNTHDITDLPTSEAAVSYGSNDEPDRDMDIFHSDDAAQAFADQTYQSAREKFL
jgi:hypothetical protein